MNIENLERLAVVHHSIAGDLKNLFDPQQSYKLQANEKALFAVAAAIEREANTKDMMVSNV